MLMSAYEQLVASGSAEPTCLETRFGERSVVPLHASDDNIAELRHYGACIWKSRKMQHWSDHIFYVPITDDTIVYKNSRSWEVRGTVHANDVLVSSGPPTLVAGEYIIPLEGGGAVPRKLVRPACSFDLAFNPNLTVETLRPKKSAARRLSMSWPAAMRRRAKRLHSTQSEKMESVLHQFKNVCLVKALRALGAMAPYTADGPVWALADGNRMLEPFSNRLFRVESVALEQGNKYVAHVGNHFLAVIVQEECTEVIDDERRITMPQWFCETHVLFEGLDPVWFQLVDGTSGLNTCGRVSLHCVGGAKSLINALGTKPTKFVDRTRTMASASSGKLMTKKDTPRLLKQSKEKPGQPYSSEQKVATRPLNKDFQDGAGGRSRPSFHFLHGSHPHRC